MKSSINFTAKTILLIFLMLSVDSCRPLAIKEEAPAINELSIGSTFRINLPENHQSGYGWQLNNDYNKTVVQALNAVWHGNKKGIDFNFKAMAPGSATLVLTNRKYIDTAGVKVFIVKVVPG